MSRLSLSVAVLSFVLMMAACAGGSEQSGPTPIEPDNNSTTSEPPMGSEPTTSTSLAESPLDTSGDLDDDSACPVIERSATGAVERVELVETSGLAASWRNDGVVWAINDSGQRAGLYAMGPDGSDLGFFALVRGGADVAAVDIEDLAIADGTLYLADIGDNGRRRPTVMIYAVDEPELGGPRQAVGDIDGEVDGEVEVKAAIEVRYPDGRTDAEALMVDPIRGELVILSKDLDDGSAPTRIYTVPLDPSASQEAVVDATLVGEIDIAALTASSNGFSLSTLLFPGSVTGADLSPDADLIALRTYGSVWLYRRDLTASVADALLSGVLCEVGSASEQQGEAVAFLPVSPGDTSSGRVVRYVTVSEGQNPPVNLSVARIPG